MAVRIRRPVRKSHHGLGAGAITGLVIGTVAVLPITAIVWWRKRNNSKSRYLGAYYSANTDENIGPHSAAQQQPTDIYAGSNYGKGAAVGPPPSDYSTELDSRDA